MKHTIFKHLFLVVTLILGLTSCEDREIITIDNQSAPIVMDLSTDHLYLDQNFPGNPALTVTWDAAKYTVPTEITYEIQTSADESFTTSNKLTTVPGSQKSASFTVDQINTAAIAAGLQPSVEGKIYMRVVSYLGSSQSLSAVSNVTSLYVTPYVLTYPDFYLVGAASYVGWDAGKAQILYKKDNLSYIYTYLQPENFRFLGQQDWAGLNYSLDVPETDEANRFFKDTSSNIVFGDHENMKFTGDAGIYKVIINAENKTLEAVPSTVPGFDFPEVYLVGKIDGNEWDAANAIPMTKTSVGEFEYTTTLGADAEFKILGQKDWADLEWGNIDKDNAGYSGFLGPKGDNGNIKYEGDGSSSYKITVNLKAGTILIKKQ